ncbi:MAG: hypothetical protein NVS1B10_03370 [Candidatus Saccharimonadales bacterium]
MVTTKQVELDALKQKIIDDHVCKELADNSTQLVFGDGNPDAELVFIGEAPGKKEDLKGLPFIGAAGKLLQEMLASIDLKREDVYITNIVKYRPPDNRDPLPAEKQVFMPYLESQIEVIQPKLIVTLGRHSMNCFMPDLQISQVHGQVQDINGVKYLPLFHPAAALYNTNMRQTLFDDFALIPGIILDN